MSEQMNHLTAVFHCAMTKALSADNKDDVITQLKTMTNAFTQACTGWTNKTNETQRALEERDEAIAELCELKSKVGAADDVIQQLHLLLAANNQHSADATSQLIFENMRDEVRSNMQTIGDVSMLQARLNVLERNNSRMSKHINELSKQTVMHLMATRFYARELAAIRQLMDLIHNSSSIADAVKSKLWDDIEAENRVLRVNALWLINRINSNDLTDAPFEEDADLQSPPRVVILMRDHMQQGLGLEITGGSEEFRPVIVSGKLNGSMADDDELQVGDRILAIDGTFVTNTTTHVEVMRMLETESHKDFIALIVSKFDPTRCPLSKRNNTN